MRRRNDGEFYYEARPQQPPDSAYFGEGMTHFTFWFDLPASLCCPQTVEEIKLAEDMDSDLKAGTEIYVAAPKGSEGMDAYRDDREDAGYNTASLFSTRPPGECRAPASGQGRVLPHHLHGHAG